MDKDVLKDYIISIRRELHAHPELSGEEEFTSGRICEELDAMGIPYEIVGGRNVIGLITNGTGKTVAFRADFDALPVDEQVDVPWKSRIPGIMHACGHDAHTACLLGAAKLFLEQKDKWNGKIYLCFQQGEEAGIGAGECVEYLKAHGGVDAVFSAHVMSILPPGVINMQEGTRANGAIVFHIDIQGKGGHGGRPDVAISAAEIMCDVYQHLISIPSNHHEAARSCVISPCVLHSGSRFNVIPDEASIEGTIRFLSVEDGDALMEKVRQTAEGIASFHGGSAKVSFEVMAKYPVINDPEMASVGRRAAESVGFSLLDMPTSSSSDNFAEFLHAFPGYYCFVGSQSDRPGTSGVHHAPDFDLDESVLPQISELFMATLMEFQKI